ncbi:MAG: hypothetical protein IPN01_34855 [Deltaproteobacteria bacterium]|nr:hypothetical protein [Deltaproteobacteria bacterium]
MRPFPSALPLLTLIVLAACGKDESPTPDTELPTADSGADDSEADDSGADDSGGPTDEDGDGSPAEEDCDDADPSSYPGAEERCDDRDNDCDGEIDEEAVDPSAWYTDTDADGYGAGEPILACDAPEGAAAVAEDCDDNDARFNPGAEETDCADPNDYNCDGSVGYADGDGDGFAACQECDDGDAAINPSAEEICDSRDNNCDGSIDEGVTTTYYQDLDGDGHGDADYPVEACEAPEGYAAAATDCDDLDAAVSPDAAEICDDVDNDCDGVIDPETSEDAQDWYNDSDGDGFGDPDAMTRACEAPSGAVLDSADCDDADAAVNPDGVEICDGQDNDCDGRVDPSDSLDAETYYADDDGDSFGDPDAEVKGCSTPAGAVEDNTDCDDGDVLVNPDALEICDSGVDNDCDGSADGADAWWDDAWAYRIPVTLTAPTNDSESPPVAVTVDFAAALAALGVSGALDEGSIRVVRQDCALGQPTLTSQFEDGVAGLFDGVDHEDDPNDDRGDVLWLFDEDGDYTTLDAVAAGETADFAIYFDTSGSAASSASSLVASTTSLANNLSAASFSTADGGLMSGITSGASPSLMSQTDSCCGNGVYFGGTWSNTPMYASGTTTLTLDGPVVAMITAFTAASTMNVTNWYWMIDGRPELWNKTLHETNASTTLNHASHFTSGIRPWESVQPNIGAGTFTTDTTDYLYADSSNGTWGISFAYRWAPLYVTSGVSLYNPYLITYANDYADTSAASSVTVAAGTVLLDHTVMFVLPHAGSFGDVDDEVFALMAGVSVTEGSPEAW